MPQDNPARRVARSRDHALRSVATILAALCAAAPARALQQIDVRDGATVEALVSLREPTRIRIADGKITDVVGNIHSGRCAPAIGDGAAAAAASPVGSALPVNASGELVVECHRARGEIYIRPVGDGDKPINLFVASADATYTLLLRRADIPADTIVLRDPATRQARVRPDGSGGGTTRQLKELLRALAGSGSETGWQRETSERPVRLWPSAQSTLLLRLTGRGLIGEHYRVRNIGDGTLELPEPAFTALLDNVVGVAADRVMLPPGDSASVYVLRREQP